MNNLAGLSTLLHQKAELDNQIKQYLETTFKDWLLANISTMQLDIVVKEFSHSALSIVIFSDDFDLPNLDTLFSLGAGQNCRIITNKNGDKIRLTFSTGVFDKYFIAKLRPIFMANPQINDAVNLIAF